MPLARKDVEAEELEKVQPHLEKLFEVEAPFWKALSKGAGSPTVVSYKEVRVPMRIRPAGQYRAFDPEGGDLGRGGGSLWQELKVTTAARLLAIEWNWKAKWATNNTKKALRNAVREDITAAVSEWNRAIDCEMVGSNDSRLGTVASVVDSTDHDEVKMNSDFGARRVRAGQQIVFFSVKAGGGLNKWKGTATVQYVDVESRVIKLVKRPSGPKSDLDLAAGDVIVVEGAVGAADEGAGGASHFNGVQYCNDGASTGTYLDLDRATYPEIRGNSVDAGGSFTLAAPRSAVRKIGNRLGGAAVKKLTWWCHPDIRDAYEDLGMLISTIQKQPSSSQKMDLYFADKLQIAGNPLMEHYSWDKDRMDGISMDCFHRIEVKKPGPIREDNLGPIFSLYGGSGGIAASNIWYMGGVMQTYCSKPSALTLVENLT